MSDAHVPGAVLVLVVDGQVVLQKGYGLADLASDRLVSVADTVWRVGSVTKTFTATAALQLSESGILDLHSPVKNYLPADLPGLAGVPGLTTHHLLTHSSGFDEFLFGSHTKDPAKVTSLQDYFRNHTLISLRPPGEALAYNDQGIGLAGLVVEELRQAPLDAVFDQHILQPLGMTDSSLAAPIPARLRSRMAKSYHFADGKYRAYALDYPLCYPAVSLVTTAADMTRFLQFQLGIPIESGNPALRAGTLADMHSRQFVNHPKLRGWCYGFAEWFENDRRMLFKDGQATGFNSRLLIMPDQKFGFFFCHNLSVFNAGGGTNAAARLHRKLTSELLDRFFPPDEDKETAPPPKQASALAHPLTEYAGAYQDNMAGRRRWSKLIEAFAFQTQIRLGQDGQLLLGSTGYVPVEPNLFQYKDGGPYYMGFGENGQGNIAYLFLGSGSFDKMPWYASVGFAKVFLGVILGWLVLWLVLWFWIKRRMFRNRLRLAWAGTWGSVSSLLLLLFWAGFFLFAFQSDIQTWFKGPTWFLKVLLALPLIALASGFASAGSTLAGIAQGERGKAPITLLLLHLTVLAFNFAFLAFWQLLGYNL